MLVSNPRFGYSALGSPKPRGVTASLSSECEDREPGETKSKQAKAGADSGLITQRRAGSIPLPATKPQTASNPNRRVSDYEGRSGVRSPGLISRNATGQISCRERRESGVLPAPSLRDALTVMGEDRE